MTRITATIEELSNITSGNGYLRVKPSSPWLGVGAEIISFKINSTSPLDINLLATPKDKVYLVDFSTVENAAFHPLESWAVPAEDCTLSQIRHFSLKYVQFLEERVKELELIRVRLQSVADSAEQGNRIARAAVQSVKQESELLHTVNAGLEEKLAEVKKLLREEKAKNKAFVKQSESQKAEEKIAEGIKKVVLEQSIHRFL